MTKFKSGFQSYFEGFGFWMKNSSLLRLSLLPLLFSFIFIVAGFVFAMTYVTPVVTHFVAMPQTAFQKMVYYVVYFVAALCLFGLSIFIAMALANILSFPFNALLAERAIHIHEKSEKTFAQKFTHALTNIRAFGRRTVLFILIGVIIFLSSFVPGLGVIGLALSLFLLTFDRLDYGFDCYGMTYGERQRFIKAHFWEIFGFAIGLGLTAAIPVINILAQPGGVVSGALLVSELKKRN